LGGTVVVKAQITPEVAEKGVGKACIHPARLEELAGKMIE